jgi:type VI secretion system secreted protein Hcp
MTSILIPPVADEVAGQRRYTMAFQAYMTIKGSKQGTFKGESSQTPHTDKIGILSFAYELTSPRDPLTGQASGRRQHQPITILKELDAASPQLFHALVTNELLTDINFEFYSISPEGKEELRYTIKGLNGGVANLKLYTGNTTGEALSAGKHVEVSETVLLEEVSFTFQTIQMEHTPSTKSAVDDWTGHITVQGRA